MEIVVSKHHILTQPLRFNNTAGQNLATSQENLREETMSTIKAHSPVLQPTEPNEAPARLSFSKRIIFSVVSIAMMTFILCGVAEIALRVLPMGRFRSAPFRQYDPVFGDSLVPKTRVIHRRGCFQGQVDINRWGFRDRDRTLEKKLGEFRIALIGDSAVEAVQVKPDEVMNIQMEKLLQDEGYKNIEVLAFGIGGIGTTQEMMLYEQKVRQFHPDLVLLLMSDNDIMNNSSTLQPEFYGIHKWYAPYYDLGPNGELVFRPVEKRQLNGLSSFLEHHSYLYYYLERIWSQFDISLYKWHGMPVYYGTYSDDPLDLNWQKSWLITAKVLNRFNQEVTRDGARLAVFAGPALGDIDSDWRGRMLKQGRYIAPQLNPDKFKVHLLQTAQQAGVSFDFLAPYFQQYRDAHHLQWPYFSFTCDPHFNPLGHRVAAEAMVRNLEQHVLLPLSSAAAN